MEFKVGSFVLSFGRNSKEPKRNSKQGLWPFGNFLTITKKKKTIPKKDKDRLIALSENPTVRMAINTIKDGVMQLNWQLVETNPNSKRKLIREKEFVANIINSPNYEDDYESFWGALLEDSLIGDCMCFEKVKSGNPSKPIFLYPVNGLTIDMVTDGGIYKYSQAQYPDRKYFTAEQIAYIKRTNRNSTLFGLSPLETLYDHIDALTNAFNYASETASNALPKYLANLGEDFANSLDDFKAYFENECMGEAAVPFVASKAIQSAQIAPISEEATYMKWQTFLATIVSHEFGVPAQFLGLEKSSDRSTFDERYESLTVNALKPYAKLIEKAINKHIIEELGYQNKLKFEFVWEETISAKKAKTDMTMKKLSLDAITINEARKELGYEPTKDEWGEDRMAVYKAKVNEKYTINGYNGAGNDGYKSQVTDNKLKS